MTGYGMIDCVSIATSHNFLDSPIIQQHRLRYREVVQKEQWGHIYTLDGMEFDRFDNLATEYFIARDAKNRVVGVTRTYPTTIPYMLSESFSFLSPELFPSSIKIMESSRLVLDRDLLDKQERQPIINQLTVACMERGMQRKIDAYVGFMLPKIWASTFLRCGWDVEWLGPEIALPFTNEVVRAALMPVNERTNQKLRDTTGLHDPVLNFGTGSAHDVPGDTLYSHIAQPDQGRDRKQAA